MRKHFLILLVVGEVLVFGALALAGTEGVRTKTNTTRTTNEAIGLKGGRSFTLDRAILTALQQNPDILRTKQEIERSRGVVIEISAQALPHINVSADLTWTDPNLSRS